MVRNQINKKIHRATLYEIVFHTRYVKASVFLMFAFLLLQPVAPALAALDDGVTVEETVSNIEQATEPEQSEEVDEETESEETIDEVLDQDTEVSAPEETSTGEQQIISESVNESDVADEGGEVVPLGGNGSETDEVDGQDTVQELDTNTDTGSSTPDTSATSSPSVDEEGDDSVTPENQEDIENPVDETPLDGELIDEEDTQEDIATSSTVIYAEQFSDLNKYQFGSQECVSVGDGAYYCSKASDTNNSHNEESLFSEVDNEGDTEIYLRIKGDTLQITDNSFDDKSPFYDPISNSVVWHQLREGRYDVFQYILSDKEELRITENTVNDTEPSVAGDYIVWQRWVDTNWEVMLYDGEKETQLTFNQTHDVKPRIKGGYVIWHATGQAGETHIGVYEIATGLLSTIEDTENGSVENPRFVLVYDTTFENGDVITKGYDFESKSLVPLHATPGSLPQELPDPDATGETRALIQNKSPQSKDGNVEEQGTPTGTGVSSTTPSVSASSTSATSVDEVPELDLTASSSEPLPLSDFDIVVTPYATTSSAQQSDSATSTNFVE